MCDRLPRRFDVKTSYKPSNVIFAVKNIKFPCATHHTIVPSTAELYRLNIQWGYLEHDLTGAQNLDYCLIGLLLQDLYSKYSPT